MESGSSIFLFFIKFYLFVFNDPSKLFHHSEPSQSSRRGERSPSETTDMEVFWFDFCFMALQHILGHFERGQLP